jgi:hypothetical protein
LENDAQGNGFYTPFGLLDEVDWILFTGARARELLVRHGVSRVRAPRFMLKHLLVFMACACILCAAYATWHRRSHVSLQSFLRDMNSQFVESGQPHLCITTQEVRRIIKAQINTNPSAILVRDLPRKMAEIDSSELLPIGTEARWNATGLLFLLVPHDRTIWQQLTFTANRRFGITLRSPIMIENEDGTIDFDLQQTSDGIASLAWNGSEWVERSDQEKFVANQGMHRSSGGSAVFHKYSYSGTR